jgi:hypothetical protein
MASILVLTTQSLNPKNIAGYVCPSCRIVFSLPKGMDGNGANCPSCDHLLTIPSSEYGTSELSVSASNYGDVDLGASENKVSMYKRTSKPVEHHEWARAPQEHVDRGLKIIIPIGLVSLILIGGLAFLLLGNNDLSQNDTGIAIADSIPLDSDDSISNVEASGDLGIYSYDGGDESQVTRVEEFFTGMFAAKTVDAMLPYVSPVKNIREKMVKFYKGEILSQSPFKRLEFAQNTAGYPGYLTFRTQTQDYNNHVGVINYSKDKVLLDWESFVAYSDMSWEELAEKRPTDPVRVRVTAKRIFYYNDEFTDDAKWQAVSLNSPNEQVDIYGYVLRNSATFQRLFNFGLSDNRKIILNVFFPEGAKKGNQVYIDSVVQDGWVIKEEL